MPPAPRHRPPIGRRLAGMALALILSAAQAGAADWRVDPRAAAGGDGSAGRPFSSVQDALSSGRLSPGDVLLLGPGDYGVVEIARVDLGGPLTIRGPEGAPARFAAISIRRSAGITLERLAIWPDTSDQKLRGVRADKQSRGIVLRNLDIRGREDARDYLRWSRADWEAAGGGVLLEGPDSAIEASMLTGTRFAIAMTGPNARVDGNVVRGFAGDGLRGLGDGSVFRYNRVQDCVKINDNHDDGFQSWSRGKDGRSGGGVVKGLVLEGNTILEWTGPADHPLRCSLQGIGLFDGMFQDLTIVNNTISVSAPHGIAVAGGINVVITNNTLVHPWQAGKKSPWIRVGPHKNGTPSRNVIVANNAAPSVSVARDTEGKAAVGNNVVMRYPARDLRAPYAGDFRPKPGSGLIGAAQGALSPPRDCAGRPRPMQPAIGACEGS